jgi:7-carboxy-7-deazaguanine synthase
MAYDHVFFTLDYKCPSSGMEKAMLLANFKALRSKDVLRFVVGTQADLEAALNVCRTFCPASLIYISPVFGAITPAEIVGFMLENNLEEWRLQLQMHKIIWDPNKRGV